MKWKILGLSLLFCCASANAQPAVGRGDSLFTLDEIAEWISGHVRFPEGASRYGVAGVERFVVSSAWDGRVFITSGVNTLSPAFEREIKGVVSRAPRCRFGGCGMDDIYKLVEVDFPSLMPDTLREDVLCVGRHLPPRFPLKGEKSGYLDGREAFVKWLSSRFRFPRHSDFSGYCDTLSLCYTVSEEGCMEDVRVEGCGNASVRSELERLLKRSPLWEPALTESRRPVPVSVEERVVIRPHDGGRNAQFAVCVDEVCRNSSSAPSDLDMIVLNPEVGIQCSGDLLEAICDSLKVNKEVRYGCSFVVERDGSVSNLHIEVADSLLGDALAALIERSEWIPARQGGENVRSVYAFWDVLSPPEEAVYKDPAHGLGLSRKLDYSYTRSVNRGISSRKMLDKLMKSYPQLGSDKIAIWQSTPQINYSDGVGYMELLMTRGLPLLPLKKKARK